MSSYGEDIIRETFEKFGDAIGVQMQIPAAMITNLGAVLQAQIDLLAELQSTGRLISAGGMALTAEQVEDVEAVVATANPYSAPAARLRALFPATEPAEDETNAEVRIGGVPNLLDATENETSKVYDEAVSLSYWLAKQLGEHVDDAYDRGETLTGTVQRLIEHIRPNRGKTKPASSPVDPAPTEPVYVNVPTWQEVPEGITYHPEGRPEGFVNRGGQPYYLGMSKPLSATFEQLEDFMRPQGPFYFIPAPTETGPWA